MAGGGGGSNMDPGIKEAIDRYVKAEYSGPASPEDPRVGALAEVVASLQSGKVQLLDVVRVLETPLNDSSSPQGRRQAIQLLADCLKDPNAQLRLNFKHVETFVHFFSAKLCDWQCVEGAVKGVTALLQLHGPQVRTLQGDDGAPSAAHIARSLFKSVHTPSHTQQVRKAVLDLVKLLLDDWRAEIMGLGAALGDGVVGVIEEERDPRNLLLSFALARTLLEGCAPECVSDDCLTTLFESLTSYFPITFTPPKDDKYGITGDDLRAALNSALGSNPRLGKLVVPFLLDSSKDISVGSDDTTIREALETVALCLERYGPAVAREHLGDVLRTARDQVVRTSTPCAGEFVTATRRSLAVALGDIPAGLTPHWLSHTVEPFLKTLADGASLGEASLASRGSRQLLVAAAEAHSALHQRVWALVAPWLLPAADAAPAGCPRGALPFALGLVRAAERPGGKSCLAPRQLKAALAASSAALRALKCVGEATTEDAGKDDDAETTGAAGLAVALRLVGLLCRLANEDVSKDAFAAICALLLPEPASSDAALAAWAADWAAAAAPLGEAASLEDPAVEALLGAASAAAMRHPGRAADLASGLLLATAPVAAASAVAAAGRPLRPPWLAMALPKLLVSAALSLACRATAAPAGDGAAPSPSPEEAGKTVSKLAEAAARLVLEEVAGAGEAEAVAGSPCGAAAQSAIADALEAGTGSPEASAWVATRLAAHLGLPAGPARLCAGLGEGRRGAAETRRLVTALRAQLPAAEASALQGSVLAAATAAATAASQAEGGASAVGVLALVPAVLLPSQASSPSTDGASSVDGDADWSFAPQLLQSVCRCASKEHLMAAEPLALEALGALLVASPKGEVEALLRNFRDTFEPVLEGGRGGGAPDAHAARGAARCWAAAAGALLRRGGFAAAAEILLKVLLAALERDGAPVAPFVPVAFQVMMPPSFERGEGAAPSKLPPLALQQLSLTVLPTLVEAAKHRAAAGGGRNGSAPERAALESAVTLLCALPAEVLCADCQQELRWCALTGLKCLKEASADAVFCAQVLQLVVRAAQKKSAWLEDDLSAVVPPLLGACASHPVPLVRLACLQALQLLIQESQGHMLPFKKQIEISTRKAVEDRKREVRLVAVACLNAWHCGLTADRE